MAIFAVDAMTERKTSNWVLKPWLEDFLLKGKYCTEITTSRKCQIVQVSSVLSFERANACACAQSILFVVCAVHNRPVRPK